MMKIKHSETLPNGITISIVEVNDYLIKDFLDKRFQILIEINGKRKFPMLKKKFMKFKDSGYLYTLKSDKYYGDMLLDAVHYHELQICDKTYEDCTTELLNLISMYNQGILKEELKRVFKFNT
jgi:hypothetical protein